MSRRPHIAIAASLILAGTGCAAPPANMPPPQAPPPPSVRAFEGGDVTVTIPDGALPEGLSPDEIAVTKSVMARPGKDAQPTTVYVLEPSGVEFKKPLALAFRAAARDDGSIPLLWHEDGGSFAPLDGMTAVRDGEKGVIYQGTVTHFSDFELTGWLPAIAQVIHDGSHKVDERFSANVHLEVGFPKADYDLYKVKRTPDGKAYDWDGEYVRIVVHGPVRVRNGETYPLTPILAPDKVAGVPADKEYEFNRGGKVTDDYAVQFSCKRAGNFRLEYSGTASFTVDYLTFKGGKEVSRTEGSAYSYGMSDYSWPTNRGSCIGPAPKPRPVTNAYTVDVDTLLIGGHYYPADQFHLADPDNCKARHYHAPKFQNVVAIDLTTTQDPDHPNCGFGKESDIPKKKLTIPVDEWDQYQEKRAATK